MAEASKELIEKVYEAIELAKSSGKVVKGANEATKALERGTAKLVAVAKDVQPPEIVMHLPLLAKEKGIPCIKVGTKEELGAAAGLTLATTAIAVLVEGEAKNLIAEIAKETKE
ncbi:MAG TPA: ribosomal L7Ae/L30e/S12e/Gadd45 family protein [Candidatus Nanoarchaeia archaeon]|nr:ribosomal L7Ae/L30e/S12e/Gadd45 family protein [Candidatus Nanoarchaeia archaeon]